ncbi:MAG: hypothetical protein AAGN15_06050 [Cyanobacteria bacterium J06581_3]
MGVLANALGKYQGAIWADSKAEQNRGTKAKRNDETFREVAGRPELLNLWVMCDVIAIALSTSVITKYCI